MSVRHLLVAFLVLSLCLASWTASRAGAPAAAPSLKQAAKGMFLIGTAGDPPGGFSEEELDLIRRNFDIVTPENYLKPGPVHPAENIWSFARPDALVKWCQDNGLKVHGHTLVWHSQTANWFFEGGNREVVAQRLRNHIMTLVGRYKGRIDGWDVVNEAINDGGNGQTENLRNSQWLQILGPEFLTLAFKWAHEADPDAKLYYNDYNIETGGKHQSSLLLLRRLKAEGAPIHGVGIQGHWSSTGLPFAALDQAIANYAALGLKVSITELDVTGAGGTVGGQLGPAGGAPAGGGPGGRGARGGGAAAAPTVNMAASVQSALTDLTEDQRTRIAAVNQDLTSKLAAWQTSSQAAMITFQPQYMPGQVAYINEVEEYNAAFYQQNLLREDILAEAEIAMLAILSPYQAVKWQATQLNNQLASRFATLGWSAAEKAKYEPLVAEYSARLARARDKAALAAAKAEFWKKVAGQLDDVRLTQIFAPTFAPSTLAAATPGRGGGTPSPQALQTQAQAYGRLFEILVKHKDSIERVTFWGFNDRRSWRSAENPLLFDANNQPKPAYDRILEVLRAAGN